MARMSMLALAALVATMLTGCVDTNQASGRVRGPPSRLARRPAAGWPEAIPSMARRNLRQGRRADPGRRHRDLRGPAGRERGLGGGDLPPPVIPASYGELHTACRQLVQETSVGGPMLDGTEQMPELSDTVHMRAWALAMQGKMRGFTCRVGAGPTPSEEPGDPPWSPRPCEPAAARPAQRQAPPSGIGRQSDSNRTATGQRNDVDRTAKRLASDTENDPAGHLPRRTRAPQIMAITLARSRCLPTSHPGPKQPVSGAGTDSHGRMDQPQQPYRPRVNDSLTL